MKTLVEKYCRENFMKTTHDIFESIEKQIGKLPDRPSFFPGQIWDLMHGDDEMWYSTNYLSDYGKGIPCWVNCVRTHDEYDVFIGTEEQMKVLEEALERIQPDGYCSTATTFISIDNDGNIISMK